MCIFSMKYIESVTLYFRETIINNNETFQLNPFVSIDAVKSVWSLPHLPSNVPITWARWRTFAHVSGTETPISFYSEM